jgi:hypothetical protein
LSDVGFAQYAEEAKVRDRTANYREMLRPSWRWLVTIPLAFLGTATFFRDEVIAPERVDDWRLFKLLPSWPWEWYALLVCGALILLVLESGHRAIKRREAMLASYLGEFEHALHMTTIQCFVTNQGEQIKLLEYAFGIKNTAKRAVHHSLSKFEINGEDRAPHYGNKRGYLGAELPAVIRTPWIRFAWPNPNHMETVNVSLEILYGPRPDQMLRRVRTDYAIHTWGNGVIRANVLSRTDEPLETKEVALHPIEQHGAPMLSAPRKGEDA